MVLFCMTLAAISALVLWNNGEVDRLHVFCCTCSGQQPGRLLWCRCRRHAETLQRRHRHLLGGCTAGRRGRQTTREESWHGYGSHSFEGRETAPARWCTSERRRRRLSPSLLCTACLCPAGERQRQWHVFAITVSAQSSQVHMVCRRHAKPLPHRRYPLSSFQQSLSVGAHL